MPSSRRSSQPGDQTPVSCGSCIAGGFFTPEPPGKPKGCKVPPKEIHVKSLEPWEWPYLEKGSLVQNLSVRWFWIIHMGSKSNIKCPYKKKAEGDSRHTKKAGWWWRQRLEGGSHTPGTPGATRSRKDPPLEPSEGALFCRPLGVRLLASRYGKDMFLLL